MFRWIVLALVCAYAVGFLIFAGTLPQAPRTLEHIKGIVVLTGGESRLDVAVSLFEKGIGERLLISGVNPEATRDELKKLSHGGKRFDCCVDLGYAAEDTFGNAKEAAAWARFHRFNRILLVTARYHMPRSIAEFQDVMPGAVIIPYPVDAENSGPWWKDLRSLRVLHSEYAKYLAVTALTAAGLEPGLDRGAPPNESHAAS